MYLIREVESNLDFLNFVVKETDHAQNDLNTNSLSINIGDDDFSVSCVILGIEWQDKMPNTEVLSRFAKQQITQFELMMLITLRQMNLRIFFFAYQFDDICSDLRSAIFSHIFSKI